jgi:transposase-like protein
MEAPKPQGHQSPTAIDPSAAPPPVRIIDRMRKIEIIAELIETGRPLSELSAKYGVTPPQMRGWSNAYNVAASRLIQERKSGAVPSASEQVKEWRRLAAATAAKKQDFTPKPQAVRDEAVRRALAGESIGAVAFELKVSRKAIGNWYFKQTGKRYVADELRRPQSMATAPKPEKRKRREYTAEEKADILKKYAASGLGPKLFGDKMGIHTSMLGRWKKEQERTGALSSHATYTEKQKIMFVVRYKKMGAVPLEAAARKLGIDSGSLRRWVERFDNAKLRSPKAPVTTLNKELIGVSPQEKIKAVARIARGEHSADVAAEHGVHPDSVKNWWKKYKPGKAWPRQVQRNPRNERRERGLGKKTLARQRVLAAIPDAPETDDEAAPSSAGGKSRHDAIVMLRMARDAATYEIKAGSMRADNPVLMYAMLALNALSK